MATKKASLNINLASLRLPVDEIEIGTFDGLPLDEILRQVKIEAERILSEKKPDDTGEKINVQGDWFGPKLMRQQQAVAMKEPHLSNVRIEGPGVIHPTLRERIAADMYCSADYIRTRCSGFSSKRKAKLSRSPMDDPPLSEREECERLVVHAIELGLMIARQDFWHEAWPLTKHGAAFRAGSKSPRRPRTPDELNQVLKLALEEVGHRTKSEMIWKHLKTFQGKGVIVSIEPRIIGQRSPKLTWINQKGTIKVVPFKSFQKRLSKVRQKNRQR